MKIGTILLLDITTGCSEFGDAKIIWSTNEDPNWSFVLGGDKLKLMCDKFIIY